MNLSEPLEGVMTDAQAAVIRVLARSDAEFSGRQVQRLAGGVSVSSAHRALASLVKLGIVNATSRPPAILYRANRHHVLWSVMEEGLTARDRFIERLRGYCTAALPRELNLTVVLFGSVARRESTAESDVDVFLVYPDDLDVDAEAEFSHGIAAEIEALSGNPARLYPVRCAELRRRGSDADPLLSNIRRDGILLHGESIASLVSAS